MLVDFAFCEKKGQFLNSGFCFCYFFFDLLLRSRHGLGFDEVVTTDFACFAFLAQIAAQIAGNIGAGFVSNNYALFFLTYCLACAIIQEIIAAYVLFCCRDLFLPWNP